MEINKIKVKFLPGTHSDKHIWPSISSTLLTSPLDFAIHVS